MEHSLNSIIKDKRELSNNFQLLIIGSALVITGIVELQERHLLVYLIGVLNIITGVVLFSSIFLSRILKVHNIFYRFRALTIGFFWLLIQPPAIYLISRSYSIGAAAIIGLLALLLLIFLILSESFSRFQNPVEIIKEWLKENYSLFLISTLVIILDQLTKSWVRNSIGLYEEIVPFEFLRGIFGLVNINNSGAAFGMFQNGALFFGLLALVVSCVIVFYFTTISKEDWLIRLALGVQLGGALGNLVDRMIFTEVTDFLYVHGFPVFNVADSAVSVGCVIIIIGVWQSEKRLAEQEKVSNLPEVILDEDPI